MVGAALSLCKLSTTPWKRLITKRPSVPIERAMTFIGKVGEIVVHLNEAHFNQCPEIVRADRRQFCPPALDVAQYPAEVDRSLHTQAG
jgi:hypothetical protein